MRNEKLLENVKFWVDQNIIHCQLLDQFERESHSPILEDLFLGRIMALSKDKYLPILIDFRMVSNSQAIWLFRVLTKSSSLKSAVLSTAFLVRPLGLKVLLSVYDFATNPIEPHKICTDVGLAIKHCHKTNEIFNAIK